MEKVFNDFNYAYTRLFITILTYKRVKYFGNIEEQTMVYSKAGKIAKEIWQNIDFNRQDIIRDDFVIMPEHIHAIICLKTDNQFSNNESLVFKKGEVFKLERIETIIKVFKSTVTKLVRESGGNIKWQKGFHCRIITSNREYEFKKEYIRTNPQNY
jgi:REP element-mobilizing transposase RayT